MRLIWILVGAIALILAIIGLVLPVMPTVPFVIISAYCFAKGYPKVYQWMLRNKYFGPIIRDWQERGAISRRTKWITTISLIAALILAYAIHLAPVWIVIEGVIFAIILVFVWTRPE